MAVATTLVDFRDDAQLPAARARTPVEVTAAVLGGRHRALIVWNLFWGGKGFYQLLREMDGIPRRTLAFELEELERNGIVHKRIQRSPHPKVAYTLTPLGTSLKVVVGTMYEWGLMVRDLPLAVEPAGTEAPGFAHNDYPRIVRASSEAEEEAGSESIHVSEVEVQ
jgi:DNA-binding HxlR family transcriptional regulator